jgi:hypothetical protein
MIYLDPVDHSVTDASAPGAIPLLASWQGGRILMMGRATSRDVMHQTLVAADLLFERTDPEWEDVRYYYGPDVDATEEQPHPYDGRAAPMPRIVLSDGSFDSRYHANLLLGHAIVARGTWKTPLLNYHFHGTLVEQKNADEVAYEVGGVELIDPDTIRSPSNVWA